MPRQGVPYDGAENGCGIWCQIKQLWTIMRTKLKSINGVPGDGDGDVKILAGTGVTINNDQLHNEITISAAGSDDAVKSVNGTLPDSDGDVAIDTGVLTLNNIAPDSDGDFTISAGSNITITPGTNEIEISASGGTPTANEPIYIDGDGKISLRGFTLVSDKNWARYAVSLIAQTDLYLVAYNASGLSGEVFCPKGAHIDNFKMDFQGYTGGNIYEYSSNNSLVDAINDDGSISVGRLGINISSSGSNADETMIVSASTSYQSLSKVFSNTQSGVKLYVREVL